MNLLVKTLLAVSVITQSVAQSNGLQSGKWILLDDRIEKNDIHLAAYSPAKLKADSFVMKFKDSGKLEYDYETNSQAKSSGRTSFLDIDTAVSSWAYDAASNTLSLTLKGGYNSLNDFNFSRKYKVVANRGGYLLHQLPETPAMVLKSAVPAQPESAQLLAKETETNVGTLMTDYREETLEGEIVEKGNSKKADFKKAGKAMLIPDKRWILVSNKITKNSIHLTSFHRSKFRINTLVLNFGADGKVEYDYESDPKLEFCAGIDFLDIDTDESAWSYDEAENVLTLTIKGGNASLDDFKFKRDYRVEQTGGDFVLHKIREHYFIDLKKQRRESR